MINGANKNEILYSISIEDLQIEAERVLGRKLGNAEILRSRKYLEFGIGESIGIIYNTIFEELINENDRRE
jgi:hypothetical protein